MRSLLISRFWLKNDKVLGTAQLATFPPAGFIFIHDTQGKSRNRLMREEGMNTNPQIYYNNKHASTPQASKRKKRQVR